MSDFDPHPEASEVPHKRDCRLSCCLRYKPPGKPVPEILGAPTTLLLGFNCAAADYVVNCAGTKCKAHIITQQVVYLRSDKKNILEVCKAHETYFNKQPLKVWYHFVKRYYMENFSYVYGRMKDVHEQLNAYLEVIEES